MSSGLIDPIENGFIINPSNTTDLEHYTRAVWVAVDVSSFASDGEVLSVRNGQDPLNDIQILTVSSGSITVNMQADNRTVNPVIGTGIASSSKKFPLFGAFVVWK